MKKSANLRKPKRTGRQPADFLELGHRLGAARSEKEVARILTEATDDLFGWDAFSFVTCAEDRASVCTVLFIDTINGQRLDVSSRYTDNSPGAYTQQVASQGARLILRQSRQKKPPGVLAFGDETRASASLMFAPVSKNGKVIGVLSVQSYAAGAYAPEDLRTLEALADHCGVALERIHAEKEIERLNSQLQQRLSELNRLNEELEHRVQARTAQLEAVNKELEAFAYSVSHDLRAPLRSIRGFSEVLLERYSQNLDERGQEFLRRCCQSSQQMDKLITDLLSLSRLSRAELQRQTVNLSQLVESIATELRNSQPERTVDFVIAPDLHGRGDERLLRIVLDNLLRNAWKFTGKLDRARIEFGCVEEPERAFFVRDNGVGFDMEYSDRLFGVFQRLHNVSQFPGSGIGLATVQRIINRHGGRAWAQAALNQGATIYFTLPG